MHARTQQTHRDTQAHTLTPTHPHRPITKNAHDTRANPRKKPAHTFAHKVLYAAAFSGSLKSFLRARYTRSASCARKFSQSVVACISILAASLAVLASSWCL